ncbi:MAG: stationary phase survival protein SurE [Bacteroides sp. SM23_62_1]|nr:MAG: stationary phase survival protein SurE [Bacteroides sp. SM23_62_1]
MILVTNDDGIQAKGLKTLIDIVRPLGEIFVIAPEESQSGMSHAITVKTPIRVKKIKQDGNVLINSCNGTPVDCIKLALNKFLNRHPDLILSGINHGSNASASILYSGTMAAAIEGCVNGIPSIGFSLLDYSPEAEFNGVVKYAEQIILRTLEYGMPQGTCLNVNFPANHSGEIRGVRICRQTKGMWIEEFDQRIDPQNREYYWLTGDFINLEPDAVDTDEWALQNNYISVVPVHVDLTSYGAMDHLKKWQFDGEGKK